MNRNKSYQCTIPSFNDHLKIRFHFDLKPAWAPPYILPSYNKEKYPCVLRLHVVCNSGKGASDFAPNFCDSKVIRKG